MKSTQHNTSELSPHLLPLALLVALGFPPALGRLFVLGGDPLFDTFLVERF